MDHESEWGSVRCTLCFTHYRTNRHPDYYCITVYMYNEYRVRACVCARVCVCVCARVFVRVYVWWGGGGGGMSLLLTSLSLSLLLCSHRFVVFFCPGDFVFRFLSTLLPKVSLA